MSTSISSLKNTILQALIMGIIATDNETPNIKSQAIISLTGYRNPCLIPPLVAYLNAGRDSEVFAQRLGVN